MVHCDYPSFSNKILLSFYRKMEDNLGEKEDDQESGRNQEDKEEEAVWMLDPSDTQNFFSHEPQ